MDWLGIAGWVVAAAVGVGWWIDRRGANGVREDLRKQLDSLKSRVK